jgi:hypothetical protein
VVSAPLQSLVDRVFAFLPSLAAGVLLAVVAWLLATALRRLAVRTLASTTLDEKLSIEAGMKPMSDNLGNVLYWVVILLFVPAILGVLGLEGLLEPLQGMFDEFFAILPNALGAVVIGIVGWFVAKILRDLVTSLLAASGADEIGKKVGLGATLTLSRFAGLLVYIFVFVPALIAALDSLQIEAISAPATEMLGTFMAAVPNLLAAAVILLVAWFVSSFVAKLVSTLLCEMGFDQIPTKIGVNLQLADAASPSRLVGKIIVFVAMVFATVEASNRLGFTQVAGLVSTFIEFGGQVLLGTVIIAVGLWIANLAHAAIAGAGKGNAPFWAGMARLGIIGLVLAMGLRAMGIADDIVNLAFALTLGSVAVAAALSFGLGGREAAGRQMDHWLSRMRGEG